MLENIKSEDLDRPFGSPAPAGEAEKKEEKQEEKKEVADVLKPEVKEEKAEEPKEEPRVPYSRFENVNKARREAEEEAARAKERIRELESQQTIEPDSKEVPSWWLRLYGDSDQSREAFPLWKAEQDKMASEVESRAEEKAVRRLAQEQEREKEAEKQNLKTLDEHLESIGALAGHDLTEKEQSDILDIIDEFTPKDGEGNYAGAILAPEKAWEIYGYKHPKNIASKDSRDSVAKAISTPTSGQPSLEQQERDKNWRPWSIDSRKY